MVSRLLQHIDSILRHGIAAGTLWPIFIAGVELDPRHDIYPDDPPNVDTPQYGRPTVLAYLNRMSHISVANVSKAREVITRVWQARDEGLISPVIGGLNGMDSPNDWDTNVAPFSTHVSLV